MAKNLKELDSLLELLRNFTSGDALTNEKFNGELKKVAQYFVEFKENHQKELTSIKEELKEEAKANEEQMIKRIEEKMKGEIDTLGEQIAAIDEISRSKK